MGTESCRLKSTSANSTTSAIQPNWRSALLLSLDLALQNVLISVTGIVITAAIVIKMAGTVIMLVAENQMVLLSKSKTLSSSKLMLLQTADRSFY